MGVVRGRPGGLRGGSGPRGARVDEHPPLLRPANCRTRGMSRRTGGMSCRRPHWSWGARVGGPGRSHSRRGGGGMDAAARGVPRGGNTLKRDSGAERDRTHRTLLEACLDRDVAQAK